MGTFQVSTYTHGKYQYIQKASAKVSSLKYQLVLNDITQGSLGFFGFPK
jgi:hypothetical protein